MKPIRSKLPAALFACAAMLAACQPHTAAPPAVRAVKLDAPAAGTDDGVRFIATVRRQQRAELSFEQGGRLAEVMVDVGERVRKGQVLARLDTEPARLKLRQAEASVAAATAQLRERDNQLRQQRAMFDDGAASQATLTAATAALQAAQAQLDAAQSDRDLAARALRTTELRAPFDGRIVARLLQPDAQAAPAQAVLQLDGDHGAQALAALPADAAARLHPGDRIDARDGAGNAFALRVRGIAARLEHGITASVLFDLDTPAPDVRGDESLQLTLPAAGTPALTVPLSALLLTRQGDAAAVYVYDAGLGAVRRREVRLGAVRGERVEVRAGLRADERVVAAGAAFLADGQKVTPMRAAPLSNGGRT